MEGVFFLKNLKKKSVFLGAQVLQIAIILEGSTGYFRNHEESNFLDSKHFWDTNPELKTGTRKR